MMPIMKTGWLSLLALISSLSLDLGVILAAEPSSLSAWPALRTGFNRAETLVSLEIQEEIATRVLDDRTLEYLHRIAPNRATYQSYKKRILERAWEPGLLQITREKVWENIGAGLGLALTQREMKEALKRLSESDSELSINDLRKLLLHELKSDSTDQEVLSFRSRQLRKRAWTQLRSAFAQAVQKRILDTKSSPSSAPREVKARYEELSAKSQTTVLWKGLTTPALPSKDLNASLKGVHQWLESHSAQKIPAQTNQSPITYWNMNPEALEKIVTETAATLPLPSARLPQELLELRLQPSTLNHPRAFLVATELSPTEGSNRGAQIELWIAERVALPDLKDAYREIDQALTQERHQRVLLRELRKGLERSPTLLKLTPLGRGPI
jgi:hypothetical protein